MSTEPTEEATFTTPLTTLLGIRHPILLAPMGDTAGGRLAAAVSEAGAFGLIGGGYADPDWLERELAVAGDARVGVGFITFALDRRPEALRLALDAGPPAIQLSFGDPRPYADDIHACGALLICQGQSSEEIALAVEAGADVIDYSVRPLWAGEGLDLVTAIEAPQAIVAEVIATAAQRIGDARHLLTT